MANKAFESVHFFGIRHHGPGCARSLLTALNDLQPDCILVEGPQEGEVLLPWVGHPELKPPVSLLVYAKDNSALASFYPLAVFSPEWQAILWANTHQVTVQLFDLPHTHKLALQKQTELTIEAEIESRTSDDTPQTACKTETVDDTDKSDPESHESDLDEEDVENLLFENFDPLDALAQAAGFEDGESWWNRMIEERQDSRELFTAINEAMAAVREHMPHYHPNPERQHMENLREAWMRQRIRAAIKQGFERIAVVCGAWHVPALKDPTHAIKSDTALLKGLPKIKIEATWAPWTYRHLAQNSGYAAGVDSPGWYEHLWQSSSDQTEHRGQPEALQSAATYRTATWLSKVAHLLRSKNLDCSSAHVIEATRLANMLATMRGQTTPSLDEINESILTVITMGETLPLRLIETELNTGHVLGSVPAALPSVPLQRSIEQWQQKLRLKPEALEKTQALDLRKELDLSRSHFFHRLNLLGIDWARTTHNQQQNRGTFRESWLLRWRPEINIDIIQASVYGTDLIQATTQKVLSAAKQADVSLQSLAQNIDQSVLANLPDLVEKLTHILQQRAAVTNDVWQLLGSLPALVDVFRYGSVRQTDQSMLSYLIDNLIERSSIGLPLACLNLNPDAAQDARRHVLAAHHAILLRKNADMSRLWQGVLSKIMHSQASAPLLRGCVCRLLLDAKICDEDEVHRQFSLNLSAAIPPLEAADWLEGFINQQALVLIHNDLVFQAIDSWVAHLSHEAFIQVLPLIRRSFADFSRSERESLATKAKHIKTTLPQNATAHLPVKPSTNSVLVDQMRLMDPVLCQLWGIDLESLSS